MADTDDVVVIGGGVNGTSIAYALAVRGAGRVVLLEKGALASGASGRSSALVRMHYTNEWDARLAWASFPIFRDWPEIMGGPSVFTRTGFLTGCASGLKYTQVGPKYPPRGSVNEIQLFDRREPGWAYERLGQITWDYQRSRFAPPTVAEILPELRQKAWEVGGDALIVRQVREPRHPEDTLHVEADVVRRKP